MKRKKAELELERLEALTLPQLTQILGVTAILGVGSYYLPTGKPPSDLDFLLVLEFSFTETDRARALGEAIFRFREEYRGEKYGNNVGSIVSLFLRDNDGYYLKVADLWEWSNEDFGFTEKGLREETERTAEFRTGWEEAPVLWRRKG